MKLFIALALGTALLFQGCQRSGGGAIEIAGSTSVSPLMELLAAEYERTHPETRININGTGSSDGIRAAADGTAQLGMSSRDLSPTERGQGLNEQVIALDGIAIILHPSSPIDNLTIEQIHAVYSGEITDWSQLTPEKSGGIAVVSREPGSGTRGAFEELINLRTLVSGGTEFDGTGAVRATISRNPSAIGYISVGSVDNSVKAVSIEGVYATAANVRNGTYRIARPFLVLSRDNLSNEGKEFLSWIMGPDGQNIVSRNWIAVAYYQ